MAREMIRSCPVLSYVTYKLEVLKTLGPNVKPHSITTSKLETSDIESPPKKCKRDSELNPKINAAIEENRKLSERLSAFDPKTITNTVINAVQGNYPSSKPAVLLRNNSSLLSSTVNHMNHNSFLVRMVHSNLKQIVTTVRI